MSDNRFADCSTADHVLHSYSYQSGVEVTEDVCADALARIRELTPPTVSEEARKRLQEVAADLYSSFRSDYVIDRIIEALGYPPVPVDGYCTCHSDQKGKTADCGIAAHPAASTPDPAPTLPVVELTADYMRMLADALTTWTELVNTIGIDDVAIPVSHWGQIVWHEAWHEDLDGPGEWVLRIGGEQLSYLIPTHEAITPAWLEALHDWNIRTFGPGLRTEGVTDHIGKELDEIRQAPTDLVEWADAALLVLAGFLRAANGDADAVIETIRAKHQRNLSRQWPDWRTAEPGKAIEHVRIGGGDE